MCSSGVGFDPLINGQHLRFRTAGIYNGVFTMWDEGTGSVWSHLDGAALEGQFAGTALRILPLTTTTWDAWLSEHPDTTVLDLDSGYQDRYWFDLPIGAPGLSRSFLATLDGIDERLPENALVIGVLAGSAAQAFPLAATPADAPLQAEVGGVPVVILEDEAGLPSLAYHRALTDGRVLDFVRREGAIYDRQTGSRWSSSGLAAEGELAGVQLTFVTSFLTEWYGWAAFHPETGISQPPS